MVGYLRLCHVRLGALTIDYVVLWCGMLGLTVVLWYVVLWRAML